MVETGSHLSKLQLCSAMDLQGMVGQGSMVSHTGLRGLGVGVVRHTQERRVTRDTGPYFRDTVTKGTYPAQGYRLSVL